MEDSPAPPLSRDALARAALDHVDALFRLACSLTGSRHEAEDLVQDAFARALSSHASFERGSNLRAWLCCILRNAFIDGRRRAHASPERPLEDTDDVAVEDRAEPLRGDRELELLRSVVQADIETALASLSPDARAVIVMDVLGFSEPELATVLGCARGTVKSKLSRARALLRAALREYER